MSYRESIATGVGSILFIAGIAILTSVIGRRSRDPAASLILGEYSLSVMIVGILLGLTISAVGFVIGIAYGNMEKYHNR